MVRQSGYIKEWSGFWAVAVIVMLLLASCSQAEKQATVAATAEPTVPGPVYKRAMVEEVEVLILESFPLQVNAVARGTLPGCSVIDQVTQTRNAGFFQIEITAFSEGGAVCGEEATVFEETVPLEVLGLPAGIYTVKVNGVSKTFTMLVDNLPDAGNAVISGQVWHDLCAVDGGEGGAPAVPTAGCEPNGDGSFRANGFLEADEPGLGGIVVALGMGACPSTGLAMTITDGEGVFLFGGLKGGTYCASIDLTDEQNASLLIPGEWTFPTDGSGAATLELAPGENRIDANFGWDYQFLPLPETAEAGCADAATFVRDVTIPDDTILAPGAPFTKTWQLKNSGTCTWDEGYSLVFIQGEEMVGDESTPLTTVAPPGETVDLSLALTAPGAPGTYRWEWMLRSPRGLLFGIGEEADTAFWLQIVVEN